MTTTQVRIDPLTGRPVLICPSTTGRPQQHGADGVCNFCPGREAHAGTECDRQDGSGGWRARAWLNPWPLAAETGEAPQGRHEVVAVNPGHTTRLVDLGEDDLRALGDLVDRRVARGARAGRHTYLSYSEGPASGRSAVHPHLQVVTVEADLPEVAAELPQLADAGRCPLCAGPEPELLVAEDSRARAWCPAASRWPFELLVAPRGHDARPGFAAVAPVLRAALAAYDGLPDGDSVNVIGHLGPVGAAFHWHLHVRMARAAYSAFGLINALYVNRSDPAVCAAALRAGVTHPLR